MRTDRRVAKDAMVVWVIDREQWPRACLVAELIESGFDAQGFEEIAQALAAYHDKTVKRPKLVVLELHDQPLDNITLANLEHTRVPVIALTGVFQKADVFVRKFPWADVIRRPVSIGQICSVVESKLK